MKVIHNQAAINCKYGSVFTERGTFVLNKNNIGKTLDSLDTDTLRKFEKKLFTSIGKQPAANSRDFRAVAMKKVSANLVERQELGQIGGSAVHVDAKSISIVRLTGDSKINRFNYGVSEMAASGTNMVVTEKEALYIFQRAALLPKQRKEDSKALAQVLNLLLIGTKSCMECEKIDSSSSASGLILGGIIGILVPPIIEMVTNMRLRFADLIGFGVVCAFALYSIIPDSKQKALEDAICSGTDVVKRLFGGTQKKNQVVK